MCISISEYVNHVTVAVGDHKRDAQSFIRQVFGIKDVYLGKFNTKTLQNDIAILPLKGKIKFNENVAPICLPDPANDYVFQKSVVSGWGVTQFGICRF